MGDSLPLVQKDIEISTAQSHILMESLYVYICNNFIYFLLLISLMLILLLDQTEECRRVEGKLCQFLQVSLLHL